MATEVIPAEAVEAAHRAWREQAALDGSIFEYNLRAAIEAAAPILLSHEREQTRLAHLDAMVNRETADKLQRAVDRAETLADKMSEQPEHRRTAERILDALEGREVRGCSHQCEAWQIRNNDDGKPYCAACGCKQ